MQINIEKWFESRYLEFPIVRKALIQYWKTIFDLTELLKPEKIRYRKDVFTPLLYCEVGYLDPQFHNEIAGWEINFSGGNYPEDAKYKKIMESAIINLLEKIPDAVMIQSSVDITPFLDLTPDLQFLSLTSCKSTKTLSPKIGFRSLKKLHTLMFISCIDLEHIPAEIGNLSNLHSLVFEDCPNLIEIPPEIGNLPNICKIKITFCDNLQTLPISVRSKTKC